MRTRNAVLIGLLALLLASSGIAATVSGTVFLDRDGDGAMRAGEKPLAGVAVSDGRQVVATSAAGKYTIQTDPGRFVFVSLPRGYRATKGFYKRIDADCTLDFPMTGWAASKADPVRFAQITDIHVTANEDTVKTLSEDLAEINSVSPGVEFILATGDLVNNGKNAVEYENYLRSIATSKLPVFNVPGNHDIKVADSLPNYLRYLGPLYYSFNVGNCHFLVVNSIDLNDEQKAWIAKDLAVAPAGSRRVVAMHYLPSKWQVDYLASLGVAAVLSGHWHGDRVNGSAGVMDLNTPPLRFGGIDRTARGFRLVDVVGKSVKSELRFGGLKHYAAVVTPSGPCVSANGKVKVVVDAYDSGCEVAAVVCRIGKRTLQLKRVGEWSWIGELAVPAGAQRLVAEIRDTKGGRWKAESVFQVVKGEHKPLTLVSVGSTGGLITLSSPKAGGGTVAIGTADHGDLKDCGVWLFDESLKTKWSFHTDSAIKNNVAISGDRVFATSIGGWLYALDRRTGKPAWKIDLDRDRERERWEISATAVEGGVVYVGWQSYIAAIDEATGKPLWSASLSTSDWWPNCYVVPTVFDGRLILMTRLGGHAFDAKTGKPLWKVAGDFHGCAISGGVIYTVKDDLPVAVDAATGKLLWTGTDKIGDTASAPIVAGEKMVAGTADGRVCAYSTKDGSLLWSFQTGPSLTSLQPYKRGASDVNSSPTVANGVVYVGASDGLLYAISLTDGRKLGSYNLGSPIASSPTIVGGRLYIGAYDGNVYAFEL